MTLGRQDGWSGTRVNPGLGQALMFMQSEESILFKEKKNYEYKIRSKSNIYLK